MLAAVGIAVYLYLRLDDEIRLHVEQKLTSHYRGMNVRVASARFIEGRGIEIRGVTISQPGRSGEEKLLEVDELFVVCAPTLPDLVQDRFEVSQVIFRRPRVWATRQPGDHWSVEKLLPAPQFGAGSPKISVEGLTVTLVDPLVQPQRRFTLREGHLRIEPEPPQPHDKPGLRRFALQGTLGGDYLQRVQIKGRFDDEAHEWQFTGSAAGVELGTELLAALPAHLVTGSQPLRGLRGRATIQFEVASASSGQGIRYHTTCQLSRGRIENSRLPYPLTDVEAFVRCQDGVITVERLNAWNGPTQLSLSGQRHGFSEDAPLALKAKVRKLMINRQLAAGLPQELNELWHEFLPEGEVDLDLELKYNGQDWDTDLVVQFDNLAFTYHEFPYHLQRSSGTLTYRDDKLAIDIKAHADDRPVRILGEIFQPGSDATGWVEARGSDVALDERLTAAMPREGREVLETLNPQGRFQFYWRGSREQPHEELHSHLEVTLNRCTIRFSKFPYPLTNIRGTITMTDDHWTFRGLEGTNDTGFVTCNGELKPTAQGPLLVLRFAGTDVPLEEELRDAFQPSAQRLWNDLKPQGRVDLTADVQYHFGTRQFDLTTRVMPVPDSTSIEPVMFPYRLEKLRGAIHYKNGLVMLQDLRAEHGATRLAADGQCEMQPDGSWYLLLQELTIDHLKPDRELLVAMPPELRRVVGELNIEGPVNVRGSFGMSQSGLRGSPLKSDWDLTFDLHRNVVDVGVRLTDIHGEVRLTGNFDGQQFQTRGELDLDSLNYSTIQLTQVRGPLWADNQRVLLGVWTQKLLGEATQRRINGQMYGGEIAGDGWVALAEPQRFAMQASLRGAELSRLATEGLPGRQNLQGKVSADVELQGSGQGTHDLAGSGNIRLREADIYELPLIVQLLKVLRVRLPDKTAFTQSNMYFRIDGEHLYFDKLDLLGDALSLYGKGEMNFNKEIDLTFHSMMGRNELAMPILRNIVGEASQQIMQVHVRGTLENPQIINQPFPVVNQALQQLQADLTPPTGQPPAAGMNPRNWFRPPLPAEQRPRY